MKRKILISSLLLILSITVISALFVYFFVKPADSVNVSSSHIEDGQVCDLMPKILAQPGKNCYITFDDGPSDNTGKILDILQEYNIKATFFVTGENAEKYPDLIGRQYNEGHVVANHTYIHDYNKIYASPAALEETILQTESVIASLVGKENVVKLFRFPGGATKNIRYRFEDTVKKLGYSYINWNALNSDADGKPFSEERSLRSIRESTANKDNAVILMHDTNSKDITLRTLPQILEYLIKCGYEFHTLCP